MKTNEGLEQFEPWELEAFADGVDFPQIQTFVAKHPALWSAWLADYQKEQQQFLVLERFDCPDPDELRDYYWRTLEDSRLRQIEAHLGVCASCTQELAELEAAMNATTSSSAQGQSPKSVQAADPSISDTLWAQVDAALEQMRWLVATLVSPPAMQAALREDNIFSSGDPSQPVTLLFEAEDVEVNLVLQHVSQGQISLSGQVFSSAAVQGATLTLIPADRTAPVRRTLVDDVGEFVLSTVPPGRYQLLLVQSDHVVSIPELVLT